jgi:hypothetical protein
MSDLTLRSLLTEDVAVLAPSRTQNAYNDEELGYPDPESVTPVKARLEQTAGQEVTSGRDTQISDWLLFLLPDVTITGDCRVMRLRDGVTFEVVGPPNLITHPRSGPHHIEARLVTYRGTA